MRSTVHDVAEAAGVSIATVDRVLNRRPGVRNQTIARVEDAVARLGFVRDIAAANLAKQRVYRLVFIIPDGANTFMRNLEREIEKSISHSAVERTDIRIVKAPPFDGSALAAALDSLDTETISGVAVVATDSALVREALARLHDRHVPVVTLVSDVPAFRRSHYVGIDNVAAGRTAASLLGRFLGQKSGKVVVVAGSTLVRDHVERRTGFEQVVRTDFPSLEILPLVEGRDDADFTRSALTECLEREAGVIGLYSIGAGNRGVIDALSSRASDGKIVTIVHELTDYSRQALRDGVFDAVINQDPGHEVRSAIRLLKAECDGAATVQGQDSIRIEIYLKHNLP